MASAAKLHQDELTLVVRDMLRPMSAGFGLYLAYTAIREFFELSGQERLVIATTDAIVAAFLLTMAGFVWFRPPPLKFMNAWAAALAVALVTADLVTLSYRGEFPAFPATALVLAGIGALILSWPWLLGTQAALWTGWLLATNFFADVERTSNLLIEISLITGVAIHWGRMRAYTTLIDARAKEAESRQALEQLNEELDRFASVVAHDLKNPLTAIRLKTRAMRSRSEDEVVQSASHELDRIVGNMDTLIDDLLAYARAGAVPESGERASLKDVVHDVRDVFAQFLEEADGELVIEALPEYEADRTLLHQLLQNLIGNAIIYRGEAPPRVVVAGDEREAEVRISVTDNGVGFDASKAHILFEPFQRGDVRAPGHGLGLATCARIAAQLGGRIDAQSTVGKGSTFTVVLPKRKEEGEEESGEITPLLQPS